MSKALLLDDPKNDYIDARAQAFATALQNGSLENVYALVENPDNNAIMADFSGDENFKSGAEIIAFGQDYHILLVLIVSIDGTKKFITSEIPLDSFLEMESYLGLSPVEGTEDHAVIREETLRLGF